MSDKSSPNGDGAERSSDVKVGAFVLVTLIAAVAIVLTLAQKRHVFERRVVIHTVFQEVEGLRVGAPVRLSGVNIGLVSRIAFARERTASQIHVDLEISRDALARIGTDSVARIGTQGLLGDKIIELSVSDKPSALLEAGATIESQPPMDFNRIIEKAGAVLDRVTHVADGAAAVMDSVSDPKSLAEIRGIISSMGRLTTAAEKGTGLVHSIFYDPSQAKAFTGLLTQVETLSHHVDSAVVHVDQLLGATDQDGVQLVNNVSRAAKNLADTAGDLHSSKIIAHLDHASSDLSELTAYVKSGRGTVGMAIMDPTLYEQAMVVLGGVGRSRVLRALVRYAITRSDNQEVGKAVDAAESAVAREKKK
jgi:phospholipid/cholesterol/gamma-HCH transport system substrate-binding protein